MIADILIKKGCNINAVNKKGRTALMLAVLDNNIKLVEYLLKNKVNIEH